MRIGHRLIPDTYPEPGLTLLGVYINPFNINTMFQMVWHGLRKFRRGARRLKAMFNLLNLIALQGRESPRIHGWFFAAAMPMSGPMQALETVS
jgi:hypothetical protein